MWNKVCSLLAELWSDFRRAWHTSPTEVPPRFWDAFFWESGGLAEHHRAGFPSVPGTEKKLHLTPFGPSFILPLIPFPIPQWMLADAVRLVETTLDERILERLAICELDPDADHSRWLESWCRRALDWKHRGARRIAWQVLLEREAPEEVIMSTIMKALERESDWWVLEQIGQWRPASPAHRSAFRGAWERKLDSRIPSQRLMAARVLEELDGKTSE